MKKDRAAQLLDLHRQLRERLNTLKGAERSLDEVEDRAHLRAREQLATVPQALHVVEDHIEAGQAGGILGLRHHRMLNDEKARLMAIVHGRGPREPDQA